MRVSRLDQLFNRDALVDTDAVNQADGNFYKKRKTCSADDQTRIFQPQAAQDKEMSVEIDADKVEDLENMPVMQEKAERTVYIPMKTKTIKFVKQRKR
ncbi:hypothetical protein EMCRGX_G014063 [Ephydatia muelleri]|eukprot:Em0004g1620a